MRRSCGCNFLYGLETNQDDKTSIQKALKAQVELKKEIMFYKKNGKQNFLVLIIFLNQTCVKYSGRLRVISQPVLCLITSFSCKESQVIFKGQM